MAISAGGVVRGHMRNIDDNWNCLATYELIEYEYASRRQVKFWQKASQRHSFEDAFPILDRNFNPAPVVLEDNMTLSLGRVDAQLRFAHGAHQLASENRRNGSLRR